MGSLSVNIFKGILLAINIFILLVGIILLSLGIDGLDKSDTLENKGGDLLSDIPLKQGFTAVIAIAASIIAVAVFGIIGGLLRIRKLLTFYVLFLFILSSVEIGLGVGILVFGATESQIDEYVKDKWFRPDSGPKIEKLQNSFECCGYNDIEDSRTLASCPFSNPKPCREAIISELETFAKPIGLFCVIMGSIQLVAMTTACMLLWRSKDMDKEFKDKEWL